jgi:tRNA A64-2'-O-ribosylphosphate transferase
MIDETNALIDSLVENARRQDNDDAPLSRNDDGCMDRIGHLNLWIGSRRAGRPPTSWTHFEAILNVTNVEYPDIMNNNGTGGYYLQLSVAEGKRDRTELERWMPVGLVLSVFTTRP